MVNEQAVTFDQPLPLPRSLSPTSASTWQQCELKYALGYVHGWREPSTLPQLIGNAVHRAVELLYGLPPADRTRDAADQQLQTAQAEELAQDTYAQLLANSPDAPEAVFAAGQDALDGLFGLEDPKTISVGPEGLEVWVSATLYGAPIRGRVDRLYDAEGAQVIADYKTGKVPSARFTEKSFFGLWTYAAALAASDPDKRLADRIELLYLIGRDRLSRPVLYDVALEHAKSLARIWRDILATLDAGTVAARTSKLCDWCAFQPACPAKAKRPLPPVGSSDHVSLLLELGLTQRVAKTTDVVAERVDASGEEQGLT